MAERIIAVKKDHKGNIVAVKTENGKIHSIPLSIAAAQAGDFAGIQAMAESRNGGYYLQSTLGVDKEGNLTQLPEFE